MRSEAFKTGRTENRPVDDVSYIPGPHFAPALSAAETGELSTLALAHIGDAVYELLMRTALCQSGVTLAQQLHRETVRRVNAPAQAEAAARLHDLLSPDELTVFKRGRNAKVNGIPQKAEISEYHAATGLETLFGWLWLQGKTDRLTELFNIVAEVE